MRFGFLTGSDGRPVMALVHTFCQACGEFACGSIRKGSIHIPCGECSNHESNIDLPMADAIPVPFQDDETGANKRMGVLSRRDFRRRFPDDKPPARKKVLAYWDTVIRELENGRAG